jgi:hypothetical protein
MVKPILYKCRDQGGMETGLKNQALDEFRGSAARSAGL